MDPTTTRVRAVYAMACSATDALMTASEARTRTCVLGAGTIRLHPRT